MKHRRNSELEELEEQLRRAEEEDEARRTREAAAYEAADDEAFFDDDYDGDYAKEEDTGDSEFRGEDMPEETWENEPEELPYRNYANSYGAASGAGRSAEYRERETDMSDGVHPEDVESRAVVRERKKRKKHRGCGCLTVLLLLLTIVIVGVVLYVRPPKSEDSAGTRKADTASILICGTDADGTRTDTMMLLYLSGSEQKASLLSLPRDTYTITASGKAAKLNSAYGRNGGGEEGMDVLMDYVADIIGYRPDGYLLLDFTLVTQIVDIMGGVDVEVPMDMDVEGVVLQEGLQHLDGTQTLALLRYRAGYATADLGRIQVQRSVMKAAMEQWLSLSHMRGALESVSLLESGTVSSLGTGNYLWVAKALALGMSDFRSDTLPGYAEYRDGVSYYILDASGVAELINEAYNPYREEISAESLNIAG